MFMDCTIAKPQPIKYLEDNILDGSDLEDDSSKDNNSDDDN